MVIVPDVPFAPAVDQSIARPELSTPVQEGVWAKHVKHEARMSNNTFFITALRGIKSEAS